MLERNAQKRLSRHPRGHRVPIFLDVEDAGGTPKEELPFIVAVLAQLSGQTEPAPNKWANQQGQEINRDNFEKVLAKIKPKLSFSVESKLSDAKPGDKIPVNLKFETTQDFEPTGVAMQVAALNERLVLRQRLRELLSLLITDTDLRSQLEILFRKEASRKQMIEAVSRLLTAGGTRSEGPKATNQ